MASINPRTASSTGTGRGELRRGGGIGESIASRTVRRCTPYFSANALIDSWLRCQSNRIAAYSSTLDPIPAPMRERTDEHPTTPTIRPSPRSTKHPDGVSTCDFPRVGPTSTATPAPEHTPGGARSEKNGGARSECSSHGRFLRGAPPVPEALHDVEGHRPPNEPTP